MVHYSIMSSKKKGRPGVKEGPLVQMLDGQRVKQAAEDAAKKLVDAAALAAERLVDATKEAEENKFPLTRRDLTLASGPIVFFKSL
jgi:hypothetical protein